jgi:hypothetical protein
MLKSGDCEREQAVGSLPRKVSHERVTILMAGDNSSDLHEATVAIWEFLHGMILGFDTRIFRTGTRFRAPKAEGAPPTQPGVLTPGTLRPGDAPWRELSDMVCPVSLVSTVPLLTTQTWAEGRQNPS